MISIKFRLGAIFLALFVLPLFSTGLTAGGVEDSYHGRLGLGSGLGMLEKWCALPNFSFEQQGGIEGWTEQSCNACHIGAGWNDTKSSVNCGLCHTGKKFEVSMDGCMTCHYKDTAKRGDVFTAEEDVHIALGMVCWDCHLRVEDGLSDHQFLKGTAIDTTEPTMEDTLSCTSTGCHDEQPHHMAEYVGATLNAHIAKVACETCHTGFRPAAALESRRWDAFNEEGKPVTTKRSAPWLPEHKWYDNTGPGASGDYHLPVLTPTERRDEPGAKIYPFNAVTVDWFVKEQDSAFDDVIIVPEVKAADANGDRIVTLEEMQAVYEDARLLTEDMTFSISHSVVPVELAFHCKDCHGRNGFVLDWNELGYAGDPRGHGQRNGGQNGGQGGGQNSNQNGGQNGGGNSKGGR